MYLIWVTHAALAQPHSLAAPFPAWKPASVRMELALYSTLQRHLRKDRRVEEGDGSNQICAKGDRGAQQTGMAVL